MRLVVREYRLGLLFLFVTCRKYGVILYINLFNVCTFVHRCRVYVNIYSECMQWDRVNILI